MWVLISVTPEPLLAKMVKKSLVVSLFSKIEAHIGIYHKLLHSGKDAIIPYIGNDELQCPKVGGI